ncbi:hypothetical protein An17g01400 [Aspergillus niger]|uniref:Uncharacterized protein n=2 Tax=Aspergillus niger TaxID=5061 RepID=E2PSW8_ASPNC|nr:hypothetical protein An17g01400 [Aspergillus niger]CAK43036.1 hypothetical protein An17g01400 [Aspergillus niger]
MWRDGELLMSMNATGSGLYLDLGDKFRDVWTRPGETQGGDGAFATFRAGRGNWRCSACACNEERQAARRWKKISCRVTCIHCPRPSLTQLGRTGLPALDLASCPPSALRANIGILR